MLIQSTSSQAQILPPDKFVNDGLATRGKSSGVSAPPSNGLAQPVGSLELPALSAEQSAEQPVSSAQLKSVVNDANEVFKQSNMSLEFSVDSDTQNTIVKLIDTETGDLVRQFPSKEMLAIASAIGQFQQGLLLEQKA
ncbi:MAG: flagellar protein FlaG [Candidatus Nitrotoga sp.]